MNSGGGSWLDGIQPVDPGRGSGAADEVTGCVTEGDGQTDQLAVGGGDHWSFAADDAAMARAAGRARLRWTARPSKREGEPAASTAADLRSGPVAVPNEVLRLERAALSRKAQRSGRHRTGLHVGETSAARRWPGSPETAAQSASE